MFLRNKDRRIGNYELQDKLGEGGMGEVYRALDVQLQRTVAVKVLHPEVAQNTEFRARFLQEARAVAALDHPNIIRIYAFDADEKGRHYLVMEYVTGGSLRGYLEDRYENREEINTLETLRLVQQVAAALEYAHQLGMVHRDVKPDNVLLKPASGFGGDMRYSAMLTDFGLAKLLAGENLVQTANDKLVGGTLPYMAPEQFWGGMDYRADIYALGIMMYELVVGRLPFMPSSPHEAAEMHVKQPPPLPTYFRNDLSPKIEAVIMKSIAKQPEQRFQTGLEMIHAIREIVDNDEITVSPDRTTVPRHSGQEPTIDSGPGTAPVKDDAVIAEREGYARQTFTLTQPVFIIGRDPKRDMPLPGGKVSRSHARLERQADRTYTITDLGSTNGTYMDGKKLQPNQPYSWGPNNELIIGEYRLTLKKST